MSSEDRTYFERRAEAEIARAQTADHPAAVRSHYLLAGYYLDLVHCSAPGLDGVEAEGLQEPADPDGRNELIERLRLALCRIPDDWGVAPPELLRSLS